MAEDMKYIVVSRPVQEGYREPFGEEVIMFSASIHHRDMVPRRTGPNGVISAGFVRLEGGHVCCYGYSESLTTMLRRRVESRTETDPKLIRKQLEGR